MTAPKKVALVTGSGKRRVGSFVADALAARGYDIAVHYHASSAAASETVARLRGQGVAAEAFAADLTNEREVSQLVEDVFTRFGRVDVLVNGAAIWRSKSLEETTVADIREHFDANALGTFLCCQKVGLAMVGQTEGGSIVLVGDWAEARPYLNYSAYFLSKGAIPLLTRVMAVELGTRNPKIRVNCVLPGPVMFQTDETTAARQESIAGTLVKREGSPTNIAQAVLSLVENDFITGACLPVDGGRTVYAP